MYVSRTVILLTLVVYGADGACTRANWWTSMDKKGLSICPYENDFISGLYRNRRTSWESDSLSALEEAECCPLERQWRKFKAQIMYADWGSTLNRANTWANCPVGYFLDGLYRSDATESEVYLFFKDLYKDSGTNPNTVAGLSNIKEGRCTKPSEHPTYYGHCYDHDISTCFDDIGLCRCNTDYYVTGLYRGGCDKLNCLDRLRCCKTADAPEQLDELYKVKTRIMDITMSDIAYLAHYLGYAWCAGCRASNVGEDFRRNEDVWYADKSGRCEGYMSDKRLNVAYGNWNFGIKEIKFGDPVIQELTPETIDSGTIYNNDVTDATKTIIRTENSIRTVMHSTTSAWKNSNELNVQVSYTPPPASGGVAFSAAYKFGFETSTSKTDETKNEQSNVLTVNTSKTVKSKSAVKWSLVLSKTRTSMAYTATVLAKFSTELQGFLRSGGGPDANYHYQYHGTGDHPTFNYRFGDSQIPFYTALKRQSDTNSQPWLWNDMKNAHPSAQRLINNLCNENIYAFTITGRFDDVIGKNIQIHWDSVPLRKRSADLHANSPNVIYQNSTHVAKPLPNDVPPVKLEPPKVNIDVGNQIPIEKPVVSSS